MTVLPWLIKVKSLFTRRQLQITRATLADITFLIEAYTEASSDGAVEAQLSLRVVLERAVNVSNRVAVLQTTRHPFVEGSPLTRPLDDLYVLRQRDRKIGVLWLRDYKDDDLAPTTFGEILLFWLHPDWRRKRIWPEVDVFAKRWAIAARKKMLVGRCLKPSRRMAELFSRSGYTSTGPKPSGLTAHTWEPG